MAADIPGTVAVTEVTLDGAPLPFDQRDSTLFAVLPALYPGLHVFEVRLLGTGGAAGPEPGESRAIVAENPACGSIRLWLGSLVSGTGLSIRVMDSAGRVVAESGPLDTSGSGHVITIPASGIPPGVYFVILVSGDGRIAGSARTVLLD